MSAFRLAYVLPLLLCLFALLLTIANLQHALPVAQWLPALRGPEAGQVPQMVFYYSLLPRLALSLLVGAGLGLVGLLLQQVLRNPLAEPATLGVASGAQLGITVVTLWSLPGGMLTQQLAATAGAVVVGALVFGVAWGRRLSPVTLILAGLVMSLYCGAVNQIFAIFNHDQLQNMFLWSTGSLNQLDWSNVDFIWPRLLAGGVITLLMLRPMMLMGLEDGVAKNLGLSLSLARIAVIAVAILLGAALVNAAGIISFIGLFAPLLAKIAGFRRLSQRMIVAPLFGALLLWLADQCALRLTDLTGEISTGTITAVIGAPLLLWLLPRLRLSGAGPTSDAGNTVVTERQKVWLWGALGVGVLLLLAAVALSFGRNADGWTWVIGDLWHQLLHWRGPRLLAALATGMMLGVAGCIMQRLTGNAMASPEVLGISSGAAFGVVVALFIVPGDAFGWLLPAGTLGAAITLLVIAIAAGRGGFSPQRMLLAGIALSTAFTAITMLLLASGDPRMGNLLTWMSGSTYSIDAAQALRTVLIAVILLALVPFCRRWLTLLPLGDMTARSAGLALTPSRLALLLLAAALTAGATLTIGPLSFVGLLAPHMAKMLGFRRTLPQQMVAALLGGGLMVAADWCGRMLAFPDQIPAGLLATFIGAPYFVYLLRRT